MDLSDEEFFKKLEADFTIEAGRSILPKQFHQFGMYIGGKWYMVKCQKRTFPMIHQCAVSVLSIIFYIKYWA